MLKTLGGMLSRNCDDKTPPKKRHPYTLVNLSLFPDYLTIVFGSGMGEKDKTKASQEVRSLRSQGQGENRDTMTKIKGQVKSVPSR